MSATNVQALVELAEGDGRLRQRFWLKVNRKGDDECWPWLAYANPKGYGEIGVRGRTRGAHRVSYEINVGPIPNGLHIDHLCRNPGCVNPMHLEAVTPRENAIRGLAGTRAKERARLITSCPAGHPYDERHTYTSKSGKRHCKTCAINRQNKRRALMKEMGIVRTA